jgi:streptomycin 6-kinase
MDEKFVKNVLSLWGDEGQQWLDNLPNIITEYEKKWNLKVGQPFKLSCNYVAQAVQKDGTEVVIKIGYPKDQEFFSELDSLPKFNSKGMVMQFKQDRERAVMLLERIKPGVSIASLDDEKVMEVMAQVMKNFWTDHPIDKNSTYEPSRWSTGFQKLREKYEGKTGPIPFELVRKAESIYIGLQSSNDPQYLLHGDLHQGNVLSATREPYLAVDPKGIIGPRERELTPLLMYPEGFIVNSLDPKATLSRRIEILAEILELDKGKIIAWSFSHTVLQAVWDLINHDTVEHEKLAIADILESIM